MTVHETKLKIKNNHKIIEIYKLRRRNNYPLRINLTLEEKIEIKRD